jgi:hypothetical protein
MQHQVTWRAASAAFLTRVSSIVQVVVDMVRRYDLDGIHSDDFVAYPYPEAGLDFDDDATFAAYPRGFTDKADWRRDNINLLVKALYPAIKQEKKHVKFGISPFGIYKNVSVCLVGCVRSCLHGMSPLGIHKRVWTGPANGMLGTTLSPWATARQNLCHHSRTSAKGSQRKPSLAHARDLLCAPACVEHPRA